MNINQPDTVWQKILDEDYSYNANDMTFAGKYQIKSPGLAVTITPDGERIFAAPKDSDEIGVFIIEAFNPTAVGVGGIIGVLMVGFQRAAFSNEAGAGSASIAHSAVKTKYAASEGLVALLEPFIDTVVICTMTALVIITFNSTGAFVYGGDGTGAVLIDGVVYEGAAITQMAFAEYIPGSDIFLTVAVVLFAVSTMISWSYYGLQSWKFLFGRGYIADLTYKVLFLMFVVIGAAASMNSIWAFSDAMIFAMVFPNMVGLYFLFPIVKEQLKKYLEAIKN